MSVEETLERYLTFPKYHNNFTLLPSEKRYQGCVLHFLFVQYANLPFVWMSKFIDRFYRTCCIVQDDDGELPLHNAVRYNIDPYWIRIMLLLSPPGIVFLISHKTKCTAVGLASCITTLEDKLVCHAISDFHKQTDVNMESVSYDDRLKAYRSLTMARRKCQSVARIFIRRRLIARNRDVSWLVALEIWASRTDELWEE